MPRAAHPTRVNHRFVPGAPGSHEQGHYEPVAFDPAAPENQYPRCLYHPNWGEREKPNRVDFETDAKYLVAKREYEQSDFVRTVTARNPTEEKKFLAKGWLPHRPNREHVDNRKGYDEI